MTLAEHLSSVRQLFLDTAPVIYFVEQHPRYLPLNDVTLRRVTDLGVIVLDTFASP